MQARVSRYRVIALVVALGAVVLAFAASANAQKAELYHVEEISLGIDTGPLSGAGMVGTPAYSRSFDFAGAAWLRFDLTNIRLNRGDYIRVYTPKRDVDQIIHSDDPQLDGPYLGEALHTVLFNGGRVEVELWLENGSANAGFTIDRVFVARRDPAVPFSLCGPTDERVPATDPCIVRVVDSNGVWGTGFMISDNWMVTAAHVMTDGPWTIERNVPASDSTTGGINHPGAVDQFALPDLSGSSLGTPTPGNDWAVVEVPDNAGGAPGAGCNPTFRCDWKNTNGGESLRVTGFGLDTENARNGTLQTHADTSVAGGDNPGHFRYKTDTEPSNSGSPVTDSAGRIVGIHTNGGCEPDSTGSNSGTLITNLDLQAAIKKRCGENICPENNPTIACMSVASAPPNCCCFEWSITNNGPQPLTRFYVDLEAGNGGACSILTPAADIVPPGAFTATFCYGWDNGVPSNWSVVCFEGDTLECGETMTGQWYVVVNDDTPKDVDQFGWIPFTVPPKGVVCSASAFNPDSLMLPCGTGQFGPHIIGQQDIWSPPGQWLWEDHLVLDFAASNDLVYWSGATWTRDGIPVVDCVTHEGGVSTGGISSPPSVAEEITCSAWPNDWHWFCDLVYQAVPVHVDVSFVNFGPLDLPGLEIYASLLHPSYAVFIDVGGNQYWMSDVGGTFHVGQWDDYPNDLPGDMESTGAYRNSSGPRPTGTDDAPTTPTQYALHQNVPNPFNPRTTIRYELVDRGEVRLTIYDVGGRRVRALVMETQEAGVKAADWDGTNDAGHRVSSGVYFYRLVVGPFVETRKMVLTK